jgi:hypothetical protein
MGKLAFAGTALLAPLVWLIAAPAGAQALQGLNESAIRDLSPRASGVVETPTSLDDRAATIPAPASFDQRTAERPVAAPEPGPEPAPVHRRLPAEVLALDSNMGEKVNDVLACRLEIAADRRVPVEEVAAGLVLLRWTVQPGGGVEGAEVVAQHRTDPDVLSCAKRKVESWIFVRAPGGEPLAIEQPLNFAP